MVQHLMFISDGMLPSCYTPFKSSLTVTEPCNASALHLPHTHACTYTPHRLRETTWQKLLSLQSSKEGPLSKVLDKSLKRDPVYPILTKNHLEAMDRRHTIIVKAVELCIKKHGRDTVIVSSWG